MHNKKIILAIIFSLLLSVSCNTPTQSLEIPQSEIQILVADNSANLGDNADFSDIIPGTPLSTVFKTFGYPDELDATVLSFTYNGVHSNAILFYDHDIATVTEVIILNNS